jgi:hypothetical protein
MHLATCLVAACSSYTSASSTDAGTDASPNDGGFTGIADGAIANNRIVYVSGSGSDANDGLSSARAVQTLSAALGLLETNKLDGYEIHLCAGDYSANTLVSKRALAVRGGYNCSTWTRSEQFGQKGDFADGNQTRINGVASATGPTLKADVSKGFTLEGVDVSASVGGFPTVRLEGAGNAVVQDARVYGAVGATGASIMGTTIGLEVAATEVLVQASVLRGGSGVALNDSGDSRGSIALRTLDTRVTVRSSTLFAGTGTGIYGGIGAYVIDNQGRSVPVRFEDATIRGEASLGYGSKDGAYGFVGITSSNTKLTLRRTQIRGGTTHVARLSAGTSAGTAILQAAGVIAYGVDAQIDDSRIDVGDLDADPSTGPYFVTFGILNVLTGELTITNSVVSAGGASSTLPVSGIAVYAQSGNTVIRHSTLIAMQGAKTLGEGSTRGLQIVLTAKASAKNSLFLVKPGRIVSVFRCQSASLGNPVDWAGNVAWAGTPAFDYLDGAGGVCNAFTSGSNLAEVGVTSLITTPLNEKVLVPDVRSQSSRDAVFGAGILPLNAACDIARGGVDLLGSVPKDITGKARTNKPAVGAWEALAGTCP